MSASSFNPAALWADLKARKHPPLHLWNPPFCGEIDMRIARDGTWFYLGTPIGRPAMVRLFASVLKREGERYVLVTPVEKVGILVEDAPFVAVEMHLRGRGREQELDFRTNVDDVVVLGPDHPLRMGTDHLSGQPAPYILIRDGLEARVSRSVFYQLVDLAEEEEVASGALRYGIWSAGVYFPLGVVAEEDLS